DLNRLSRAWTRPETIVVHESWWTATARRADIVLPANTTLERNDIGGSSRDNYVFAMQRAIPSLGESRSDFDIFSELAERGGYAERYTARRGEAQWLREIWRTMAAGWAKKDVPLPTFEGFWEKGWIQLPPPQREYVLLEEFRADPSAHPLKTPSGRIELWSDAIAGFGYDDCPPHPAWLPPSEWLGNEAARRYPLHLITVQPADRLHSQMDPGPLAQARKVAGRERLRMNPRDAGARGLADGDVARIRNDRGACLAGVALDAGLMPGVAVIATGAWFDPAADGLERSGNPNVLAMDVGTSRLAQGPSALSLLVEVDKWTADAPAVGVYDPPALLRQPAAESGE
ncbi:MAG TPA: molybdopterin dinucleotide binding domain-containing protein, partial [Burkholderiales bacterium]|nr:molybdopterin dinucleotide binding domain-containing protein [Burkholderiales bacterium]